VYKMAPVLFSDVHCSANLCQDILKLNIKFGMTWIHFGHFSVTHYYAVQVIYRLEDTFERYLDDILKMNNGNLCTVNIWTPETLVKTILYKIKKFLHIKQSRLVLTFKNRTRNQMFPIVWNP
jgi:hypothetical protein